MKKLYVLIIALLLACGMQAQNMYMKTFRGTGTIKANLHELLSGNLVTGMARGRGVTLMDPLGAIVHTQVYLVDTFLAIQSVQRYKDNKFYFVGGYYKDQCPSTGSPRMYPAIGQMDSLGTVQWASHYVLSAPNCATNVTDLVITSQKEVVAWSNAILKLDSMGELQWAKRFEDAVVIEFIKALPNGELLAGINMENAGAAVARLDASGNFLWLKSYFRPLGRAHDAIVESDGSFVIAGYTEIATTNAFEPYLPAFNPKFFALKLDGSGDVLWCRGYSTAPFHWFTPRSSRIVRARDGNYTVLANIGVPTQNWHYRPLLMKLSPNGDTLWTRSSGHVNYSYETRSLLAYSDGSYIFNGRIWGTMPDGTQNNWAYLYKTDSLGHLPCYEVHYPMVISELFPVDSNMTLLSIDGAERRPAFITDTIYDPLVVYDACSFTTNLPPQDPRTRRSMSIRPNPNTGRFTVQFTDPLMAESYYSVYDALGKLLYQRPLPAGATVEEVDLSRFGRGTYVVKLTDPEGVRWERVVLE